MNTRQKKGAKSQKNKAQSKVKFNLIYRRARYLAFCLFVSTFKCNRQNVLRASAGFAGDKWAKKARVPMYCFPPALSSTGVNGSQEQGLLPLLPLSPRGYFNRQNWWYTYLSTCELQLSYNKDSRSNGLYNVYCDASACAAACVAWAIFVRFI
jgi:hypothetical protein